MERLPEFSLRSRDQDFGGKFRSLVGSQFKSIKSFTRWTAVAGSQLSEWYLTAAHEPGSNPVTGNFT